MRLEKPLVAHLVISFHIFHAAIGFIPCSQEPATCSYSKPHEYSLHSFIQL